jgi:hypothetical protein
MRWFDDPDGRPPEDLTAWLAAGMRRVEALAWRRWNFTLADAKQWRAGGVGEALTAAQWHIAGVTPETVGDWFTARITVGEAIRWHEFGFDLEQARKFTSQGKGPEEAYNQRRPKSTPMATAIGGASSGYAGRIREFMQAGVPHEVMGTYLAAQWTDDEALSWATAGIQAAAARLWQLIGLVPAEARELTVDPAEVIRDWWRAGIPYDEVADWLGAGLTAEEAVAQRADGVTVEQAAALRALRRGAT